jgi:fatty-acyl-CoA synthase
VQDTAVVGLAHPKWQEPPLALVVLRPGHDATQGRLREHLSATFARWQLPDQILFVDSIPKTSVGKLDKKAIRARYAELYESASGPS